MSRTVNRKEQEEMGAIRTSEPRFIAPAKEKDVVQVPEIPSFDKRAGNSNFDIQVRTSKVDEAQAFLVKTWQISVVTGIVAFIIGWSAGAHVALAAIVALGIFAGLQLAMHWQHLVYSPENIARHNANRYWNNVDKLYDVFIEKYRKDNGLDD